MIKIEKLTDGCVATVNGTAVIPGQLFYPSEFINVEVTNGVLTYSVDELSVVEQASAPEDSAKTPEVNDTGEPEDSAKTPEVNDTGVTEDSAKTPEVNSTAPAKNSAKTPEFLGKAEKQ